MSEVKLYMDESSVNTIVASATDGLRTELIDYICNASAPAYTVANSVEQLANRVRFLEIEYEKLAATLNEVFTMVKEANEDGLWGSADMNAALDSFLASIPIIERG